MPRDPVNVNICFSVTLVVANALSEVLAVVVAERVVSETTVSVNVNVFVVIVFNAELNANAYAQFRQSYLWSGPAQLRKREWCCHCWKWILRPHQSPRGPGLA